MAPDVILINLLHWPSLSEKQDGKKRSTLIFYTTIDNIQQKIFKERKCLNLGF